ncbi:hypothetical protein V6N11_047251 [Hibiscus sabdariffa]|uniref:Amidase domain-containing protein n=1 Tax=Hibiscus sabdariffa TaxID=183260 RepID=A0ABR2A0D5_9ROSI
MATTLESGALKEKFVLQPNSSSQQLPLVDLLLLLKKCKFDVDGYVTGFGNPDWKRTHSAAVSMALAVLNVLEGGATCVGKTVMDEMAYSINEEDIHYDTPTNSCALDRVPGGSSSGSAIAVGAGLVEFSLGLHLMSSVLLVLFRCPRVPILSDGLLEILQFYQVGRVLLHLPNVDPVTPSQIIIREDCFSLSSILEKHFGGQNLEHVNLGEYVKEKVPNLQHFMLKEMKIMRTIFRLWQPFRAPRELLQRTPDEDIDVCHSTRTKLCTALTDLLQDESILVLPTVPGDHQNYNQIRPHSKCFMLELSACY